jgi:predicted esterase
MLCACGGGGSISSDGISPNVSIPPVTQVPPVETSPERFPTITLTGEHFIQLSINDAYVEQGATATDIEDGDISSNITLVGVVDSSATGDYFVHYQVSNSAGGVSSVARVIRVFDTQPTRLTRREKSITGANLSYLEHLPSSYGVDISAKSPLIIFNHGSGATGSSLSAVECCGLPLVLKQNGWDTSRTFVILSPQRVLGTDPQPLDTFLKYALATYNIDPKRVYMAGWSQGAFVSLRYAVNYPDKVAAIGALAGGFFQGVPSNVCIAADKVPLWTFLGSRDSSVVNAAGTNTTEAFNNCSPTQLAKLSIHTTADHFATSNWPFQPVENSTISSQSDPFDQSVYDWFLSFSLP